MADNQIKAPALAAILLFSFAGGFLQLQGILATKITVQNKCVQTLWISSNSNQQRTPRLDPDDTDFVLNSGDQKLISPPPGWAAHIWARTRCLLRPDTQLVCATGDCKSGSLYCDGAFPTPPVTFIDFMLGGGAGNDTYDVSLIAGFNVPVTVAPTASECSLASCDFDINSVCPQKYQVLAADGRAAVACRSACEVMKDEEGCCAYDVGKREVKCTRMAYKEMLKVKCPKAMVYADDGSDWFRCGHGSDYIVTFCPE
ncbi:thaumatin-like protein 1b [Dendrobium catenatum]|nr:thaumatin-like protein 1b [Dendrobium catenatum]